MGDVVRDSRFRRGSMYTGAWLSKRELADRLHVSTRTIDRWVTRGMPRWQNGAGAWRYVGERRRFLESEVLDWLDRCA